MFIYIFIMCVCYIAICITIYIIFMFIDINAVRLDPKLHANPRQEPKPFPKKDPWIDRREIHD